MSCHLRPSLLRVLRLPHFWNLFFFDALTFSAIPLLRVFHAMVFDWKDAFPIFAANLEHPLLLRIDMISLTMIFAALLRFALLWEVGRGWAQQTVNQYPSMKEKYERRVSLTIWKIRSSSQVYLRWFCVSRFTQESSALTSIERFNPAWLGESSFWLITCNMYYILLQIHVVW